MPRIRRFILLLVVLTLGASTRAPVLPAAADGVGLDIVFVNGYGFSGPQPNRVCLRDPEAGYRCSDVEAERRESLDVALGDLDGNGTPDAVFASERRARVCLALPVGGVTCRDIPGAAVGTGSVALGDVNGDGRLDAVFAGFGSHPKACLGDGAGSFACSVFEDGVGMGMALGDVDGDGDLDAVSGNRGRRPDRLCLGDGAGGFTCGDLVPGPPVEKGTSDVALGDLDADGDLDAVFADRWNANRACLGDGAGGFTCSDMESLTSVSEAVALGFVDGDQHLDAVFANEDRQNTVCLGDGAGAFACRGIGDGRPHISRDVALGDVDGDGKLDAVFANARADHVTWVDGELNQLCRGDGEGGFTCEGIGTDLHRSEAVALGELGAAWGARPVRPGPAFGRGVFVDKRGEIGFAHPVSKLVAAGKRAYAVGYFCTSVPGTPQNACESAFTVLDTTRGGAPVVLGRYTRSGRDEYLRDLAVRQRHAYAVFEQRDLLTGAYQSRIAVFDVAVPSLIIEVASVELPDALGHAQRLEAVGDRLYVGASAGVLVYSLADPKSPVELSRALVPTRDIAVSGTTLYTVGEADTRTFDVADPAAPVALARLSIGGYTVSVWDALAFIVQPIYCPGDHGMQFACSTGLGALDVSDPRYPVSTWWGGTALQGARTAAKDGERLYVATGGGLHVVAWDDPDRPIIGRYSPRLEDGRSPSVADIDVLGDRVWVVVRPDEQTAAVQVLEVRETQAVFMPLAMRE